MMNDIATDNEMHNQVMKKFVDLLNEYGFLPPARYGAMGAMFDASFGNNISIQNTDYLANSKLNYLHFTSLDSAAKIINGGVLRLYNLHKSSDKKEYSYAMSVFEDLQLSLNYSTEITERRKQNLFYTSFTQMSSLDSKKHWEEYADNSNGVAIEFAINDDYLKWHSIFLSTIKYGRKDEFKPMVDELIKLHSKYNLQRAYFYVYVDPFMGLHKQIEEYEWEDEVRILIDFNKLPRQDKRELVSDDKEFGENVQYFELPLWSEENEMTLKEVELPGPEFLEKVFNGKDTSDIPNRRFPLPQLVIKKLHYMNSENTGKMKELQAKIKEGLGYDVELVLHRLN